MDFVLIENAGKRLTEQFPAVKYACKRIYQLGMFMLSKEKIKAEGEIIRVSPEDGYEYFFGYYDKSPWDMNNRYMIALKVHNTYKMPAPKMVGELVLLDSINGYHPISIAKTRTWNVQQGCMAGWLGPDFKSRIIYNDFREGRYCSVVFSVASMKEERVYELPVYEVSRDGKYAISLDFSRLHRLRPGYGYSNLSDETAKEPCPDKPALTKLDLETGEITVLKTYKDFTAFETAVTMKGAKHKVNHVMISPNGSRFMVLHRWLKKGRKYSRLITMNMDGSEMYNLSDDVFVSHCYWKNNEEILSFLRKKEKGDHYYLLKDRTQEYKMLWAELNTDGHCSYSPDGSYIITDTYPNRTRMAAIYLCSEQDKHSRKVKRIGRVFAPFHYDNTTRCDLHPRWNRTGDMVCIDSAHEGKRALYIIPIKR